MDTEEKPHGGRDGREVATSSGMDAWSPQKLEEAGRTSNGTPLQYSCLENPMDGGAW